MIIYVDILSGDEMFSDAFKIIDKGRLLEVEGKTVSRSEDFDESKISANKSAEEEQELCETTTVSGPDIVLNHKLQKMDIDKQEYMRHIKSYAKRLKAKIESESGEEKAKEFQEAMGPAVKSIMKNINNYDFYKGESMSDDGMIGLLDYREDGITPYMVFLKDGLRIEKC